MSRIMEKLKLTPTRNVGSTPTPSRTLLLSSPDLSFYPIASDHKSISPFKRDVMDRSGNRESGRDRYSERNDERYHSKDRHHRVYGRCHRRARGGRGDGSSSWAEAVAHHPGYDASLYGETVAVRPEFNPVPEFDQVSLENGDKASPGRRPEKGGSFAARHVNLLVNHFPVTFNPETMIWHYDVDIKPEAPVKPRHPARLSKDTLAQIKQKLFSDNHAQFPSSKTAYDGEKNIFSVVQLPCGTYNVKIGYGEEDSEDSSFQCSIKLVNEFNLLKLRDYLAGDLMSIPRDILQVMDLVMKENPQRHMMSVGRHFYLREYHKTDDLNCGVAAFRGSQHSLKPTRQGLALSLDCSVMAFRKSIPVIDFLKEHISGFIISKFARYRREVEQALKEVKVTVNHRRTKQKYTVEGLTKETTRSISFSSESPEGKTSKVNLVNYFQEKYGIDIEHKDIPCLDFSKNNKKQYVPMELCELVEGQRYPKEKLGPDASTSLKNISMPPPHIRKKSICDMMRSNTGPCGDVSRNFGIEVDMNMTKVRGRVIKPPELKMATLDGKMMKIEIDKNKCQWNLMGRTVVDGKPIERWVIVNFSVSDRQLNPEPFIQKLISKCRNLGIRMEEPLFCQPAAMSMLANVAKLTELLEGVNRRACVDGRRPPQFLLCVMSKKDPGYKLLKWICETQIGLVTQCCLSANAKNAKDQILANLALKINAKLEGSNVELSNPLPHINDERHVMFLGADVNHPASRDMKSPSFAAVVGTVNWPAANRYAAMVRPQLHRQEKIVDIGEMCLELVETYARLNGVRPRKLILFRDGVSESQFDMVLNEEFQDLKKAFAEKDYNPTITIMVALKRHQTRLFLERDDVNGPGNVPPGTVVDTTVVHLSEFGFYLCSHYGSLGTSKPTYYRKLWDEHGFSYDHLEELTYSLCFTSARCTKSVSLVMPVCYADLAAFRGRLYYEAVTEYLPSSTEERFYYKLHADVENKMFFI